METLDTVLQIMKPGAFAGSLDLKDAYYSVPIYADHTKYLKFSFNKKLYKFVALPNDLKSGHRVFSKIMRVAMSEMRSCGYESATYLDDVYLQANTRVDCQNNVRETAECLMSLGFVIDPATSICHIGFLLNLTTMEMYLPPDKAKAVTMFCNKIAASINPKIREVARCIGLLVSCCPAVPHGKLFYRQIEMDKIKALTQARGNFEKTMTLSADVIS